MFQRGEPFQLIHGTFFVFIAVSVFIFISPGLAYDSSSTTVFAVDSNQSNRIVIQGSSTVRDWSCRTNQVDGRFRFATARPQLIQFLNRYQANTNSGTIPSSVNLPVSRPPIVKVRIPIRSFDCGREAMNEDMYQALKADSHPDISYLFYGVDGVNGPVGSTSEQFELMTTGGVALGGEANTITFPVSIKRVDELSFVARGTMDLKMKEFGVTPPTALFGLIKAYNKISISFRLHVSGDTTPEGSLTVPSSLNRQ